MATDKQQGGREAPPFSAQHLDIAAFAEAGACLAGETVLSHYPRLADEVLVLVQDLGRLQQRLEQAVARSDGDDLDWMTL